MLTSYTFFTNLYTFFSFSKQKNVCQILVYELVSNPYRSGPYVLHNYITTPKNHNSNLVSARLRPRFPRKRQN